MKPSCASYGWDPRLSLGVERIDAQHRALCEQAHKLCGVVSTVADQDEIFGTLASLGSYVANHFEDEEQLMRETGYPGLDGQVLEHGRFTAAYKRLCASFARSGADRQLVDDVKSIVCQWFDDHIMGSDRQLAEWLVSTGRAPRSSAGSAS